MKYLRKKLYTLLEMIVALVILSLMVIILTICFNTVNNVSNRANAESETFQNARIALDIISRDIQCVYYNGQDIVAFYHEQSNTDTDMLCFISDTSFPAEYSVSTVNEVIYTNDLNSGELWRRVTGDKLAGGSNNPKWNFPDYVDGDSEIFGTTANCIFTPDNTSSSDTVLIIPYVTKLNFKCYADSDISIQEEGLPKVTFPYSVDIELGVVDRNTWNKMHSGDSVDTPRLIRENGRIFTKSVLIGNRGQYN